LAIEKSIEGYRSSISRRQEKGLAHFSSPLAEQAVLSRGASISYNPDGKGPYTDKNSADARPKISPFETRLCRRKGFCGSSRLLGCD